MASFQRRTGAYSFSVVYDASEEEEARPHPASSTMIFAGWPPKPYPPSTTTSATTSPTGLELFPALFCSPEWPHPAEHWPSVVMLLLANLRGDLERPERALAHFHDPAADLTYYMMRLDRRLTAVLMYYNNHQHSGGRRGGSSSSSSSSRDVAAFLREVAAVLNCSATMARLKPGAAAH